MRVVCIDGPDFGRTLDVGDDALTMHCRDGLHVTFWREDDHLRVEERPGSSVAVVLGDTIQIGASIFLVTCPDEWKLRILRLQKLEAMAAVTAGLAHDFNNLLTIILNAAEILEREVATSLPVVAQAMVDQKSACRSAATLVRRLLGLARNDTAAHQHFSVDRLVAETLALVRGAFGHSIHVSSTVAIDAWLHGRHDQLQQVLLNVFLNARDAMPAGGQLDVTASVIELGWGGVASPGEYVEILVRDSGVGMSRATLARAFEPFFTTKPPGRGTGLGLASAQAIIREHGGTITASSYVGEGTVMRILLPAAREAS